MPSRDDAILAERQPETKRSHGVRINQTDLFNEVGGPSVRQSWGECSADISSARNCGSFPLARLTRFSKIVVGEEASVIVSFQANGKDGPDRGGKQQVPLPVPGSRCT